MNNSSAMLLSCGSESHKLRADVRYRKVMLGVDMISMLITRLMNGGADGKSTASPC